MTDHVPPQNLDAEESVLGAMMMSPQAIVAVSDVLAPSDFYRESHGIIYQAALALDQRGEPVDAITVTAELERSGRIQDAGGKPRIMELAALVPASANAGHYARLVKETALHRALIRAGGEISNLGWNAQGDPDELIDQAESAMSKITEADTNDDLGLLGADTIAFAEQIIALADKGEQRSGLRTGLSSLDKTTTGFYPGQLIVIAARPAMGKSALGLTMALNIAARGTPAAYYTLEMSREELGIRWLARTTKIDPKKIQTANLNEHEKARLRQAIETIREKGAPLHASDRADLSIPQIRASARRAKRKNPNLGILFVDYLGLMLSGSDDESRQQEVAKITRGLKLLAKELEIPVVALSQLNRGVESRENKRPLLSDLRDSGAIEQDADIVLFLYRESAYKRVDAEKENDTELIVAKNRMGEAHKTIHLLFIKSRQMFTEPAKGAK